VHRGKLSLIIAAAAILVAFSTIIYTMHEMRASNTGLPQPLAQLLQGKPRVINVVVEGAEGGRAPVEYTCDSPHPKPPVIRWNSVKGARAYAVIVLDPDAPLGTFIHLVAYDGVETRWPAPGYKLGLNSAGRIGWYPICPPRGDKPHHYYFVVIALKSPLGLDEGASLEQLLAAIDGGVVGYGYTVLVYKR